MTVDSNRVQGSWRKLSAKRENFGQGSSQTATPSAMSSQAEPRPSTDRAGRDGGYDYQGGYRQQNYQPTNIPPNTAYAGRANGLAVDGNRQRNGGPTIPLNPPSNGNPPPNNDPRSGRVRSQTQDRPPRERSRPTGASGGKSNRICKKCDQPLTGQFVRALGGTFHLECFLCRVSRIQHLYENLH